MVQDQIWCVEMGLYLLYHSVVKFSKLISSKVLTNSIILCFYNSIPTWQIYTNASDLTDYTFRYSHDKFCNAGCLI